MAMSRLLTTFGRYVPDLVAGRLHIDPLPLRHPVDDSVPGAVLFADISGFSTLASNLAQHRLYGAEELNDTLNNVFGELIALITATGGDIVTFAGDALLAIWSAQDEDMTTALRRAAQCSLALQTLFSETEQARRIKLTVRMGIGVGDVRLLHVGGVDDRWLWMVTGTPLVQAAAASYEAGTGRVVLSAEAWKLVERLYGGHIYPETGSVRLDAMFKLVPPRLVLPPRLQPEMEAALQTYLPRGILDRLIAGHGGWLGELRRVTVLFVALPELHDPRVPLARVQAVVAAIQDIIYRYEGSVNKISVDEKGVALVAAMGLPPQAHEDDAVRGVQAALAVHTAVQAQGMSCALGVTTGDVFCGDVGNDRRREYTVLGTVVNQAARLMQHATDATANLEGPRTTVLCDEETYLAARQRIAFEGLPALEIKGEAEPVAVFSPRSALLTDRTAANLIGREREQRVLTAALEPHPADTPAPLWVVLGETGSGKSLLLDAVQEQALQRDFLPLLGAGDSVMQMIPYYAWLPVFRRLVALRAASSSLDEDVYACLNGCDQFEAVFPLIMSLISLEIEEHVYVQQVHAFAHPEMLQDGLLTLLRCAAQHQPLVLSLEDAHLLDNESWHLLEQAIVELPDVPMYVTLRTDSYSSAERQQRLLRCWRSRLLQLQGLALEESQMFLERQLHVPHVPRKLVQLIHSQAQGNPVLLSELTHALQDEGLLTAREGVLYVGLWKHITRALRESNTVQVAMTTRMDRLRPEEQLLLKVASVIGKIFPLDILRAVHPFPTAPGELEADLRTLEGMDIIERLLCEPEPVYQFTQVVMREVVYRQTAQSQRRQLHLAIGEWYTQQHGEHLNYLALRMAHHFELAEDKRALTYVLQAGTTLLHQGGYQRALTFFARALNLIDWQGGRSVHISSDDKGESGGTVLKLHDAPRELLRDLFLQRGRAFELLGCDSKALDNYRWLEDVADQYSDMPLKLVAVLAQVKVFALPSAAIEPRQATRIQQRALGMARGQQDEAAEAQVLWCLMLSHSMLPNQGDQALRYGEQALALAQQLQLHEQRAVILNSIALLYWTAGQAWRALEALHEAQEVWHTLGNVPKQADNLARQAVLALLMGENEHALHLSDEAHALSVETDSTSSRASSRLLTGHIFIARGQIGTALALMHETIDEGEAARNLAVQIGTRADLGWLYGALGQPERGLPLLKQALILAQNRLPVLEPWVRANLARVYIGSGHLQHAAETLCYSYTELLTEQSNMLHGPALIALATAELALARAEYTRVVYIVDDLLAYMAAMGLRLFQSEALLLKGQALVQLDPAQAAEVLSLAQARASEHGAIWPLWRILLARRVLALRAGHTAQAAQLWEHAHTLLSMIKETLPEPEMRAVFGSLPAVQAAAAQTISKTDVCFVPQAS